MVVAVSSLSCCILCADGYGEEAVWRAHAYLQAANVEPVILGLKLADVVGSLGKLTPIEALISRFADEEAAIPLPTGMLLAGGVACGQKLLADPRVHLLIHKMRFSQRPVGYLFPTYLQLVHMLNQQASVRPLIVQQSADEPSFLQHFVKQLASAGVSSSTVSMNESVG